MTRTMTVCRIALTAAILAAIGAAARPAPAAYFTGCCACVADTKVATAGPPSPMSVPALFCSQVVGMGGPAFAGRCDDAGGQVYCEQPAPGESCTAALAAVNIACPSPAGVPAAGGWGLTGLIAGLGALGAGALRRRGR